MLGSLDLIWPRLPTERLRASPAHRLAGSLQFLHTASCRAFHSPCHPYFAEKVPKLIRHAHKVCHWFGAHCGFRFSMRFRWAVVAFAFRPPPYSSGFAFGLCALSNRSCFSCKSRFISCTISRNLRGSCSSAASAHSFEICSLTWPCIYLPPRRSCLLHDTAALGKHPGFQIVCRLPYGSLWQSTV